MVPQDFQTITLQHLQAIRALGLTGAAFHGVGEQLFDVQTSKCKKVRTIFAQAGMDLPQFGIAFGECLFDYDTEVCAYAIRKIGCGIEVARELNAHTCLIRTGSLNPAGSYSPCKENLLPESKARLIGTLKQVAAKAELEGVTVVIETHALTIMDSPETNKEIIDVVGSDRMGVVMDYVNHFQSMSQVYNSTERLNHIFDYMGPISFVAHCKDIRVKSGLVLHIDEEVPGEGELDMVTALQRWHDLYPDGYMLLEHLGNDRYPYAAANVQRICVEAGIEIH
jgi:sugar phosphate isomerase/epimerase